MKTLTEKTLRSAAPALAAVLVAGLAPPGARHGAVHLEPNPVRGRISASPRR